MRKAIGLWLMATAAAAMFAAGAALDGNKITANGTYTVSTITGKKYTFSAGGTFGSGTLAVNWHDAIGNTGSYTGSPLTAADNLTFTASTNQVDLVLTGATSPVISITLAQADASFTVEGSDVVDALNYTAATGPDAITWVARIKADDLATGAITSIPSGGTAGTFTGTGTVTAAATGFNTHKAITFNGSSNLFSAPTGGLSLNTDWYVGTLWRSTNVTISGGQSLVAFGTEASTKRRLVRFDQFGRFAFSGSNADYISNNASSSVSTSTPFFASNTTYFTEIVCKAGAIKFYINGVEYESYRPSITSFTDAAIKIGANLNSAELFSGTIGEVLIKDTIPATEEWRATRRYISSTYGISMAAATASLKPSLTLNSSTLGNGAIVDNGSYLAIGSYGVLSTGSTTTGYIYNADVSLNGNFAAFVGGNEHDVSNFWSGQNVLNIRNKCDSGFSAIRYSYPRAGEEGGAMGLASGYNGTAPWGEPTYGSTYLEASNFRDATEFGSFRLVQTRASDLTITVRYEVQRTGDQVWYSRNGAIGMSNATLAGYTQMALQNSTGNLTLTAGQLIVSTQKTPSSATDTGTKGMICSDASYIYVCTATNTWKRVAISTW